MYGSFVLIVFSFATAIFQISCQKTVDAQTLTYTLPPATNTTLGGVIIGEELNITSNGTVSVKTTTRDVLHKLIFKRITASGAEIWTANYDGTNAAKVNISLPPNVVFSDDMSPIMSPDGQKIFFTAAAATSVFNGDLYSCNVDGTNIIKIVDKGGSNNNILLGAAY
jgi:Tol biopolymer transport system component